MEQIKRRAENIVRLQKLEQRGTVGELARSGPLAEPGQNVEAVKGGEAVSGISCYTCNEMDPRYNQVSKLQQSPE